MPPRFGPYMQYLEILSKKFPYVEYMLLWMLVGCAPPKWRFLKHSPGSRAERVARTHVSIIEYDSSGSVTENRCRDSQALRTALSGIGQDIDVRLFVVEDLSRDVVEMLGSYFQLDPTFFLSHLSDHLFHNVSDRWASRPDISLTARHRLHLSVDFLRARFFATEEDFEAAERESGMFNVLRRLDSDRSRTLRINPASDPTFSVSIGRSKASSWWRPAEHGQPLTGVLLVDPTVSTGLPLWGKNRPFEPLPTMDAVRTMGEDASHSVGSSMFEEVIYWSCRFSKHDLVEIKKDPRTMFMPMLKIIIAEWLAVFKYMTTCLARADWSFETAFWREHSVYAGDLLRYMRPWRDNLHHYQWMIKDAMTVLFSSDLERYRLHPETGSTRTVHGSGLQDLKPDFEQLQQRIDYLQMRIERLWDLSSNVEDNTGQLQISVLATIFLPLNFATSFLSMSDDISVHNPTFWLFFAIGFPLVGVTILIVIGAVPVFQHNLDRLIRSGLKRRRRRDSRPNLFGRRRNSASTDSKVARS